MNKIIIVSPHFPPSNLAAVHRSRLFAMHLPSFNWEPVIVTVHENYYEEELDWNLHAMLPKGLRIEKVKAIPVSKRFRFIGDIGLRGFVSLTRKVLNLIKEHRNQQSTVNSHQLFLYIPIPSFYSALIGRIAHELTGIKYGIDYIDPWVHTFPGSDKKFSRHWYSTQIAKFLEPIAVKKASLITGCAEGYYQGVIDRNPHLLKTCKFIAMPYGGEASDHTKIKDLNVKPYLFEKKPDKIQLVYAGAMLPKAYTLLEEIFKALAKEKSSILSPQFLKDPQEINHKISANTKFTTADIELHFIGTGRTPNDPSGYTIKPLAEKYNLWQSMVFEYPKRIPYLEVLIHLENTTAILVLGSTEPHYTPSKVYQGVISGKPIFAILHQKSTACKLIEETNAGMVLKFNGEAEVDKIKEEFTQYLTDFISYIQTFDKQNVKHDLFDQYSAKSVSKILAETIMSCFN